MGEWRKRARDGGGENESEGWGEWRKRARDGGTAGREIWREWEGRMRARDGSRYHYVKCLCKQFRISV